MPPSPPPPAHGYLQVTRWFAVIGRVVVGLLGVRSWFSPFFSLSKEEGGREAGRIGKNFFFSHLVPFSVVLLLPNLFYFIFCLLCPFPSAVSIFYISSFLPIFPRHRPIPPPPLLSHISPLSPFAHFSPHFLRPLLPIVTFTPFPSFPPSFSLI